MLFIQVLDGSEFHKKGSQKIPQGKLIEQQIRELLPLKKNSISHYQLHFVSGESDEARLKKVGEAV